MASFLFQDIDLGDSLFDTSEGLQEVFFSNLIVSRSVVSRNATTKFIVEVNFERFSDNFVDDRPNIFKFFS